MVVRLFGAKILGCVCLFFVYVFAQLSEWVGSCLGCVGRSGGTWCHGTFWVCCISCLFVFLYFVYIFAQLSGLVPVWVVWAALAEPGAMVLRAFCGRHGKFLGLSGCAARKTLSMGQERENKLSINDISKRRGYMPCWAACLH